MAISAEQVAAFQNDGAVLLPSLLTDDEVAEARRLYDWSMGNPGPLATDLFGEDAGFKNDLVNPAAPGVYAQFLQHVPFAESCATLWGAAPCWFMYEQVFRKDAAEGVGRTPWHQDLPYLAVEGDHLAVFWISFEELPADQSLEFIKGSHKGTLYNGSAFDPEDETKPAYPTDEMPRIPAYEQERDAHDIISFAVKPGDVVAFHPATMHGGAPTPAGRARHTLSLRFFGQDAVFAQRPFGAGLMVPELKGTLKPGDPFRHEKFLQLR